MKIVQMSDIHVGSGLFRPELLSAAIEETNDMEPDLVAIVGDLTMEGYRWEFEEAKGYLDRIRCPNVIVGMGNHDARNVGYRHFEEFFGMRERAVMVPVPEGEAKVVVLDSTKPDLDDGDRRHPPPHSGRPRNRARREHPPGFGRRDGDTARAQGGYGPLRTPPRTVRLEHLGGQDRPLGYGLQHAGTRDDAAVLQRHRDRRGVGQDHAARARQG